MLHKRMVEMIDNGEELPVDLKGKFIYYVGPVDPVVMKSLVLLVLQLQHVWINSHVKY